MKKNRCRIVAGKWRSRFLHFPSVNALRPTPDAVRETVFNWLTGSLRGARCLDLYAGSGALGFEAVSRGAASAVLVEKNPRVVKALRQNQKEIDTAQQIQVTQCAAMQYLATAKTNFDLVFLDPPYTSDEMKKAIYQLEKHDLLADDALIYIEAPVDGEDAPVPDDWQSIKAATRGAVRYTLWQKQAVAPDSVLTLLK